MTDQLDCALDLMRRLPPQRLDSNLQNIVNLVPDLLDELLASVDQPLKIARDAQKGKDYLLCDYNRDGDSYRSPWSNTYDPPLEDGTLPSDKLRQLEMDANNKFDIYREMYFEGGVSSVYMWELDVGFAAVVLIKKAMDQDDAKGCWDSIHVVEVVTKATRVHYKLTSTVMLWLEKTRDGSSTAGGDPNSSSSPSSDCFNLGGSLTRMNELELPTVSSFAQHVPNIGRLIEDSENKIRQQLNDIYFGTTKNVVDLLRSAQPQEDTQRRAALVHELVARVGGAGGGLGLSGASQNSSSAAAT